MNDNVISLSPTMQKRLNFSHPLMDNVDDYKMNEGQTPAAIVAAAKGDQQAQDDLIMGFMWLAKDVVCRYRAHFAETQRFTDDMASVALEALTEFVRKNDSPRGFFNRAQSTISGRIRDFINDNRSTFSAGKTTNQKRMAAGEPTEYNFAVQYSDDFVGEDDVQLEYVDILDAVEQLRDVDKEQLHSLITLFLKQNHNIDEASLSEDEKIAIEKLSEIGERL